MKEFEEVLADAVSQVWSTGEWHTTDPLEAHIYFIRPASCDVCFEPPTIARGAVATITFCRNGCTRPVIQIKDG